MKKVKLVPFVSILAISLLVSLGSLQTVNAHISTGRGHVSGARCVPRCFYYTVWMPTGEAESNLEWLVGVFPMHWWGDSERPPFPPEEYTKGDSLYVCHGDWKVYSVVYEDTFRYRWWIIWESEEAAGKPGAKSLGGYFIFSHGTGDFENMWAFGRAWVEMLPGEYFPLGYQHHVGFMFGGP